MVEQDLESSTIYHDNITTAPGGFGYYRRGFPYARYPYRQTSSVTSHPMTSYIAVANIIIFSDAGPTRRAPQDDDHTYNARDVLKQLGPRIIRPDSVSN